MVLRRKVMCTQILEKSVLNKSFCLSGIAAIILKGFALYVHHSLLKDRAGANFVALIHT
jgi:hypothetical protein